MPVNEHLEPYGRWSPPPQSPSVWSSKPPNPQVVEDTLKFGLVQIERKTFALSLKENIRGRLLRITEETSGKRNSIIIPATGLGEFKILLDEMVKEAHEFPVKNKALE